jgi:hypothetical protein
MLFSRAIVANDAVSLLLATGFELKVGTASDDRVLHFVREDPALLYTTISLLDTILLAIQPEVEP